MNVFLHELKMYRRSVITWTASLAALSVLFVFLFNAVLPDIESFKIVMRSMPDIVQKMLIPDIEGISRLEGFYSFVFLYIVLCGAIQAMNIGVSIVSKEVRDKTADFLLTKPVSRGTILSAKLAAGFSCLVFTNAVFIGLTLLSTLSVAGGFSMKIFMMIMVTMFFVQLIFFAMGVLISVLAKKVKSSVSVSMSTVFGFFIISMLGSVIGDEAVRWISPFQYFDLPYIVENSAYEAPYLITGFIFVLVAIVTSYIVYIRKDVHSV